MECKLASLLSHYGVLLSSVSCQFKTEKFQACRCSGIIWSILFYNYYKSMKIQRKCLFGSEVWYVAGNYTLSQADAGTQTMEKVL